MDRFVWSFADNCTVSASELVIAALEEEKSPKQVNLLLISLQQIKSKFNFLHQVETYIEAAITAVGLTTKFHRSLCITVSGV